MKQTKFIIVLIILALTVRLVISLNTYVITSDAPLYIEAATYYYQGDFKSAFAHPYHPLYPFLMSLTYRVIGNWEWAGVLVSIILSSLAVIPLYLIGQRLFANPIVLISVIFYIFHPHIARLSSGILTTGTFILMLTTALYFFMRALENWYYLFFGLTGVFTLMAFLTRPDGIIMLPIFFMWIFFVEVAAWWRGGWRKKLYALIFLLLPWLAGAIPYIGYLITRKGEFTISNKLSLSNLQALINPMINLKAFYIVLKDLIKSVNPWLLVLILTGLIMHKGTIKKLMVSRRSIWLIWSVFLVYLLILLKFADVFSRISKRYTTPLIVIIIFWGAIGLYYLVGEIFRLRHKDEPENHPGFYTWLGIGTLITISSFAIFTFKPVDKDKFAERKVGEWIRQYHHGSEQPIIVTSSNRIPYYGGGKIIKHYAGTQLECFGISYQEVIKNFKTTKVDYLVVDKNKINSLIPDFTIGLSSVDLKQIYPKAGEVTAKDEVFIVYEVGK